MNPRRVHALFLQHESAIDPVQCDWIHLFSSGQLDEARLASMLSTLGTSDFLIHVQRKIGDYLPHDAALAFIRAHIGQHTLHVCDRDFTRWVIVAQRGGDVAAGWGDVDDIGSGHLRGAFLPPHPLVLGSMNA